MASMLTGKNTTARPLRGLLRSRRLEPGGTIAMLAPALPARGLRHPLAPIPTSIPLCHLLGEGLGWPGIGADQIAADAAVLADDQQDYAGVRVVGLDPAGLFVAGPPAYFLQ